MTAYFYISNSYQRNSFPIDTRFFTPSLILLSLDGDRERHNIIRGDTYDRIMKNIDHATADNICFYMAVNQINKIYRYFY